MIFADINTFYAPKAGGIKTYHHAKIDWFKNHPEHQYYLIYPSFERKITSLAPNVTMLQAKGIAMGKEKDGYYWMSDEKWIREQLAQIKPDVLETGDALRGGPIGKRLKSKGIFQGVLSSFYHSNPVQTWCEVWIAKGGSLVPLKKRVYDRLSRRFYRNQREYELTLVTSEYVKKFLAEKDVLNTEYIPFGVHKRFFTVPLAAHSTSDKVRLLWIGRLGAEKGADLLVEILPQLMENPRFELTVVGRGYYEDFFKEFSHSRYQYKGYISDQDELLKVYAEHQVVLAPGPFETFGLSVLEGLAAGKIVIAPNQGGAAEMVKKLMNPTLFEAGNADDFLRAIEDTLVLDWQKASEDARRVALQYGTWDDSIGHMVDFYTEYLDTTPKQAKISQN